MKRITTIIPISLILLTLTWLASANITSLNWAFFPVRALAVQYTGILAIVAMSMAMLLALRLPIIERFTQGLDKSYRLHKWLGISSLVLAVIHWLWAAGPKYMIGLGLLARPSQRGRGAGMQDLAGIEAVFARLRHFAE